MKRLFDPRGMLITAMTIFGTIGLFVQNFTEAPVSGIELDGSYADLESGETVSAVSLNGFDVKILKKL